MKPINLVCMWIAGLTTPLIVRGGNTEEYKSKGWTASLESGYTFKVGENVAKNATYFIQPKAQVIWMGARLMTIKKLTVPVYPAKGMEIFKPVGGKSLYERLQ
ncbi:autotransporter protein [Yersinia frederiksenii]|nr:autotransporter protein [Yersinia frederiksenii]CNL56813.1 autotransporter protein [Yersinia frederiksenii]